MQLVAFLNDYLLLAIKNKETTGLGFVIKINFYSNINFFREDYMARKSKESQESRRQAKEEKRVSS